MNLFTIESLVVPFTRMLWWWDVGVYVCHEMYVVQKYANTRKPGGRGGAGVPCTYGSKRVRWRCTRTVSYEYCTEDYRDKHGKKHQRKIKFVKRHTILFPRRARHKHVSCTTLIIKHGEVFPKKASRGVWGSSPQPPEAGFLGRFRRNRNRQSISINFPKRATKP